jgi:hypothetical protein
MANVSISLSGQLNDPITEINCGTSSPKLGGSVNISLFPELTGFYCTGNDIQNISDITKNTKLRRIEIFDNQLTQIPSTLSGVSFLEYFDCSNNQITGNIPNLRFNSNLAYFNCSGNDLSEVNGNILPFALKYFDASNNNLSSSATDSIITSFLNANNVSGYLNLSGANQPPSAVGLKIVSSNGLNFSRVGSLVTANVTGHNLLNQEIVSIDGIIGSPTLNGTYKVSTINSNQFTYNTTGSASTVGAGLATVTSTSNSADGLRQYQILSLPISQGGKAWNAYISPYFIRQLGATIYGSDIFSSFGSSVAINGAGTRIVVGSPTWSGPSYQIGKITIFDWNGEEWSINYELEELFGQEDYQYGFSVSISENGNTIAVGAPNGGGSYQGYVDIVSFNGSSWVPKGLIIEGTDVFEFLGSKVSLSGDGDTIAISSPGFNSYTGRVKIYKFISNNWVQLGASLEGVADFDSFGDNISLSKNTNTIAISASDRVEIYTYETIQWSLIKTIYFSDTPRSLSLNSDGTILAIGINQPFSVGRVDTWKYNGTSWNSLTSPILGNLQNNYQFGFSVSLNNDGTHLLIGDWYSYNGIGDVKIYKFNGSIWKEIGVGIAGQDGENSDFGGSVAINSDGSRFIVGARNSNSVRVYELLD